VARVTSWRRDATFGARVLASFDGAGRGTPLINDNAVKFLKGIFGGNK